MLNFNFITQKTTRTAFCMSETSYSVATLDSNNTLLSHQYRNFTPNNTAALTTMLLNDVRQLHLIGQQCQLILPPTQYQLILMDAVDVPEAELAKALKWRLKGLIDYPLNDIAMDAFLVPPHGVAKQQKKAFVAVTPLSKLKTKIDLFQSACIDINEVGITEIALQKICCRIPKSSESPIIVISLEERLCQLHVFYNDYLYLTRALQLPIDLSNNNQAYAESTLLEIQRSIDYCLVTLKIPEPQQIYFTPGFFEATYLFDFLKAQQTKSLHLLDLNALMTINPPLTPSDQQKLFYCIGGALNIPDIKKTEEEAA